MWFQVAGGEFAKKVGQLHVLVDRRANLRAMQSDVDHARRIQPRGERSCVEVGLHRAEADHRIGRFDEFAYLFVHQPTVVHPDVVGMVFVDDRLVGEHGCERQSGGFDELDRQVADAEPVEQHARQHDVFGAALRAATTAPVAALRARDSLAGQGSGSAEVRTGLSTTSEGNTMYTGRRL